jgi:hypothetical protein
VNPSPPAAPSGLTASQSGTLVLLTWQDNSSNETVFYIERCQGEAATSRSGAMARFPSCHRLLCVRDKATTASAPGSGGTSAVQHRHSNRAVMNTGRGNNASHRVAPLTVAPVARG